MDYPLTYEEFKFIYSKVPRLNVELVAQSDDGILLTKRAITPWKGFWHLPGGTVYFGETLHQAVLRVAMNELGVEVKIIKQAGYIEYPSIKHEAGFGGWPIGIAFLVSTEGKPLKVNSQAEESEFFEKLPDHIVPEQKTYLEKLGYHS